MFIIKRKNSLLKNIILLCLFKWWKVFFGEFLRYEGGDIKEKKCVIFLDNFYKFKKLIYIIMKEIFKLLFIGI